METSQANPCRNPCKTCPWGVESSKAYGPEARHEVIGGAFSTEQMLGQAVGPFWLPCHMGYNRDPDVHGKDDIIAKADVIPQCAGAAIFRANIDVADVLPTALLKLDSNSSVFDTAADFYAYHKQVNMDEAEACTTQEALTILAIKELRGQTNRNIKTVNPK